MNNRNLDSLEKEKLQKQIELDNLLKTGCSEDKMNELKAEIRHLEKQIEKIVGKKEISRRRELKKKTNREYEINKERYFKLKQMVKRISPMNTAVNRLIVTVGNYKTDEMVKVR